MRYIFWAFLAANLLGAPSSFAHTGFFHVTLPTNNDSISPTILYIDNENKSPVDMLIMEQDNFDTDAEAIQINDTDEGTLSLTIPPDCFVEVRIPDEQIHTYYFSLSAETNVLTPNGKCFNLKKGCSYYIRFTEKLIGTGCMSQEVSPFWYQSYDTKYSITIQEKPSLSEKKAQNRSITPPA